jgi:cytochrome c oxidase subunit II
VRIELNGVVEGDGKADLALARAFSAAATATLLAGCAGPASALSPRGPGAERIASLWWFLLVVALVVYLLVAAVTLWAVRGANAPRQPHGPPRFWPRFGVVAGGIVLPLLVVPVLCVVSVRTQGGLLAAEPAAHVVEVTAHQWWWELRYVGGGANATAVTANELHVPVGRRVELRLFSADVIHSLWVPALQGKLDLIPGKTNITWLRADRPGTYHGLCAEFCGVQHSRMALLVVALPPADFDVWLEAQRRPAAAAREPDRQRAQQIFLAHCAQCHAVRGTSAFFGRGGPDLTHVASRRTLAAGALTNVKGHLAGWIADPQTLKPGNRMPRIPLPSDEFHALVDYVASLH